MKRHVWRRYNGDGTFTAACGRRLPEPEHRDLDTVHSASFEQTTCLLCLQSVRDSSLWRAERAATAARAATERLEQERRKRR